MDFMRFLKNFGKFFCFLKVDTGLHNIDLLDKVYSWNGLKGKLQNNSWYGEQARMINGTGFFLFNFT